MKFLLVLSLIFSAFAGKSQGEYTISGTIKDFTSGEDIPSANITVDGMPQTFASSNIHGFYSLTLKADSYTLRISSMGYKEYSIIIELSDDMVLNIELSENNLEIGEATVESTLSDEIQQNEGSLNKMDLADAEKLPTIGGEKKVFEGLTTKPGFKTAGEGNSGIYVRGGGLDQNLILLDDAPVYNPSHLLGFFSVFNGDALKGVTAYKGGMNAEYGGRTSSVMDVRMKDGNSKTYQLSGGIGLISSRLTAEGPIKKDKGSIMISGRRTYADLLLGLSSDESLSNTDLFFYDLNLKANYTLSDKDRIYLSGYFGRDKFGFDGSFGLNWGNATSTLRWNHIFSPKFFSKTTLIYSDYDYEFAIGSDEDRLGLKSIINDLNGKQDFTYYKDDKNTYQFGYNIIRHKIQPGNLSAGSNTGVTSDNAEEKLGLEGALYFQHAIKVNPTLNVNYGLRMSGFAQYGEGTSYNLNESGSIISSEFHEKGEIIQTYSGLEPRLSVNKIVNSSSSLKLGFNRNFQYIHLLTNATTSNPTDVWIMSSNNVKPQSANQISLGYFKSFKTSENKYSLSSEIYYKTMDNAIDYRNGADLFFNEELESDLVYGTGDAYGLELGLKKNTGKLTGWLSYTLSKTSRQFDEINNGESFSARQDRTHDISLVAMYEINDKLSLSGNFTYYTGDAVTFPTGKYSVDGAAVPVYTERNGYRMPDYHRLDLGLTWKVKSTDKFESSWSFSLYNAYGRENAYSISFRPNEDNPDITEAVQLSLFKIVPSFSYNFKIK